MEMEDTSSQDINIVAGLIADAEGRVLLVRKRGTEYFMQPGGKLDCGESQMQTLAREIREELGCAIIQGSETYLGRFSSQAANEPGYTLNADLYRIELEGRPRAMAEIVEIVWLPPNNPDALKLAPFTRDAVLPLV